MPPETTSPHLGHRQLDWNTHCAQGLHSTSTWYLGFQGLLWLALPCQDIECKIEPFSCCINIISLLIYVINRQWRIQEFMLEWGRVVKYWARHEGSHGVSPFPPGVTRIKLRFVNWFPAIWAILNAFVNDFVGRSIPNHSVFITLVWASLSSIRLVAVV